MDFYHTQKSTGNRYCVSGNFMPCSRRAGIAIISGWNFVKRSGAEGRMAQPYDGGLVYARAGGEPWRR